LEARDSQGRTPFLLACGNDEATACFLLELGADFTAVDTDGLTALHWAACAGYRQLCELLLERGVEVSEYIEYIEDIEYIEYIEYIQC